MSTGARWPSAPADVSTLTDPDAATDASLDAAVHQAILEFNAVAGFNDGTRTALELWWGDEFRRITDRLDGAA